MEVKIKVAVRDRNFINEKIKDFTEGKTDDETIAILEDLKDTLDDYENKLNDTTDWKSKYEELDKDWRKRYTERFYNEDSTPPVIENNEPIEREKTRRNFNDLFEEVK